MDSPYVELHAHSFYSFGEGASHVHELIFRAQELGYSALALTDTNMCGALEFARTARQSGLCPISGAEVTLLDGSHLTLLARNRKGYSNICRLLTLANEDDRLDPKLDPAHLPDFSEGIVLLTGCRKGRVSLLVAEGRYEEASKILLAYREWFGAGSVYVELQQGFNYGDTHRNYSLVRLARDVDVPVVATNGVHYHVPERYRLQNALVAIKHNLTFNEVIDHLKVSGEAYLKSPEQMRRLFRWCPQAIENTVRIAERCSFDLTKDLGYKLPAPPMPDGYTHNTYLQRLAYEAAMRRYGQVTEQMRARLEEELRLISRNNLAGFLLLYHEIVKMAYQIMLEDGLVSPETPLEESLAGRGRGSSVSLFVGYLIGLSHVDPLLYGLSNERFLPEGLESRYPDIDVDFMRGIREKLIARIHQRWGKEHAVLVGAIARYRTRGVIEDLGKAFGIPKETRDLLKKQLRSHDLVNLKTEMLSLPAFKDKVEGGVWRDLIELAPQLKDAPKGLGQHVGGMILSTTPIPDLVPVKDSAIEGRFIMDWDRHSIEDAGFAKIDLLSLPVLDQMEEARRLVEGRYGKKIDISQIPPDDKKVYEMIGRGDARGVFDLQSPAQLKMGQRLRPRTYKDIAYQVALIRPGVGVQGSAVSKFLERYRHGAEWEYDHPLERRALERGYGIIVWQEQVVQLIMDVSGLSGAEADQMRRDFGKPNNEYLISMHWQRFREGATKKGAPEEIARKIFLKLNGQYMFPESHSYAFGITAYQAAWFKLNYPLEFFTSFMNAQPMGFYPLEAIKEDARRHGIRFLNPDVNRSQYNCTIEDDSVLLGFRFLKNVGAEAARSVIEERERNGPYLHAGDLVRRTGLKPDAVESLVMVGAFDSVTPNRKLALWEAGLYPRPVKGQLALPLNMDNSVPELPDFSNYEKMWAEYRIMDIYPKGHLMEFLRPSLPRRIMRTKQVYRASEGEIVTVAGWPIARQHPKGEDGTVFVTVQDEFGDVQLILWPKVFARYRRELMATVIIARGEVSRWDGTTNLIVSHVEAITDHIRMPQAHDWH